MASFSETGAQTYRNNQLNSHLAGLDAADAESDHIGDLQSAIRLDTARVAELIWDNDSTWACDAIAHAMSTGDWLYVQNQAEKHVAPLIQTAAEEDAAAEAKAADEARGEALFEAMQDKRSVW